MREAHVGISIGLVGLGDFGSAFADLFKSHPLVDRVALCDLEPERVGRFASREDWRDKLNPADAYTSLEDICASDVDALAVITQPWLHAPQCVAAMEAGKHVYSAVPIISLPDGDEILEWCNRLVETVRRTGMHYMLGETTVYRPQTMYCRRRAAEGAFGRFVHAEAQYFHDVDDPGCNLRDVQRHRSTGRAGQEWRERARAYRERGAVSGPMHYPTHSVSGPVNVMGAHMTRVVAWGQKDETGDDYFGQNFTNEVALFHMSNGATCRIAECRRIGHTGEEIFRIFGTQGSFREDQWVTKDGWERLDVDEMRDPLPPEVAEAFRGEGESVAYGGHGGSHAYLVHEFVSAVAAERVPALNVWEAVRYMAPGVTAHKSCLLGGELLDVPDWGDAPSG
jgi:predicted dehydrogenase